MKSKIYNHETTNVKIDLTKTEKYEAKKYAKNFGYTFQGWLGSLVRAELKKNNIVNGEN
ncbi:MAG: hypothetical protein M0P10_11375 [Sphaerochaetaceae bacterium]|nr:hypothetical protein [Sphaerochaetaceae bacterium]